MAETMVYKGTKPEDRFTFEENFDIDWWLAWTTQYKLWSIPISALYILLVFSGRRWMENRPAYRLKGLLILWNVLLGGFSIFGAWRTVPVLTKGVMENGWRSSVCNGYYYHKDFVGIWGLLFTLSKVPELGDTFFIVVRKQKLMLLHWYHHATVPLFVFAVYSDRAAPGMWFTAMNYVVHGLMYPYFGLRAAGFKLPRVAAMSITSLQIVQMIMGTVVVVYAAIMHYVGVPCEIDSGVLVLSVSLYFSYLILFAQFFHKAYFGAKPAGAKPVKSDISNGNVLSNGGKSQQVNTNTDNGVHRRK
ncbi:elongation of very long chain fatty acids protein 6-like [Asterias rubens]|uniref:elongation of very long chain fatty acids protein 6-like n=1 Tax=Asterias rubens TaxID=7604 RepID=UPI001455035A|nr:elongation of very long chain fatty acids protein 6-like [Asterias rubens]